MKARSTQMQPFPEAQTVKQAVLATLSYFDLFGVALTRGEISEHLLGADFSEDKLDIYLKESPLIHYHNGYFSLHREHEWWSAWRHKQKLQKSYFKKVSRYRWLFELCPFIRLVSVCNTLPIGDVHENSDIDLFVVAQKGRLFLARWWLTALTTILGLRRHGEKIKKRFCLSFYVTEENLDLSTIALEPNDLYLAFWVKTLEPISGDYALYEKWLSQNLWIKNYFKTVFPKRRYFRSESGVRRTLRRFLEWILDREKYELSTRNRQLQSIAQKQSALVEKNGTIVSNTMLKFHDHDAREEIQTLWKSSLEKRLK